MGRPTAIEVEGVSKSFRIPEDARSSSRLPNPLRAGGGRDLEVLRDISFSVERGEFFGIVGRNGSGKSTLLKLLASIYRADRGAIRVAGRLAPFLELGVGFNPELAAYDNVVLNGTMMGLRPAQAKARYEEIVHFAGLEDHTDLKLKNYSSGMKVRLGFAVMTHVDADVLLIDEVLAVGDAEFQEKCGEVFRRMHDEGRTMLLVTHSMPAVLTYCERAMLLHEGRIEAFGDPERVTDRYLEINMRTLAERADADESFASHTAEAIVDPAARIVDLRLTAGDERYPTISPGEPIELEATVEFIRPIEKPRFYVRVDNSRGQGLFVAGGDEIGVPLEAAGEVGERLAVRARIENRFPGGRYLLRCGVLRAGNDGTPVPAGPAPALRFEVPGGSGAGGLVALGHEVTARRADRRAEIAGL